MESYDDGALLLSIALRALYDLTLRIGFIEEQEEQEEERTEEKIINEGKQI